MPQNLRQKGLYACQTSAIFFFETRADGHQGFCSGDSNASQNSQGLNRQEDHSSSQNQTMGTTFLARRH